MTQPKIMSGEIDVSPITAGFLFGLNTRTTRGLIFGYTGGTYDIGGQFFQSSGGTLTLTANTINYVQSSIGGSISFNTVGFTAGQTALYEITTDSTTMIDIIDRRQLFTVSDANSDTTTIDLTGSGTYTLSYLEAKRKIMYLDGVLSGNRTVIVPVGSIRGWTIQNRTTGNFTVTVKTPLGNGIIINRGTTVGTYLDGTAVNVDVVGVGSPSRGSSFQTTIEVTGDTIAVVSGTAVRTFRMPRGITLTAVRASLVTAQATGSILTIDINETGVSIFSTTLTIDNTSLTSVGAIAPAVISDAILADDAEITIDVDQIGDGTAKGLKVTLIGYHTA